jgi:hypothetical protein
VLRALIISMLSATSCLGCNASHPLPPASKPVSLDAIPIEYDDHVQRVFAVSPAQWQEIAALFTEVHDAPLERAAIGLAVARLEQIAGEQTPIWRDGRKNHGAGPGETDCLDESTNTTTFLRLMREQGLLKHHRVMTKAFRSPLQLDIHWTAVVQDAQTGQRWVIDSWYNANGIPPIIQPLDDWKRKKVVPGYYAEDKPAQGGVARSRINTSRK